MKLSCKLVPGPEIEAQARHAESLGYERVWVFDSPALYWDCWATLAHLASRTTIDLGVAVAVPGVRHVVTTASCALTIAGLTPNRLAVALGTGYTARLLLGEKAHPWADVEAYASALRSLLRGDEAQLDGHLLRMLHGSPSMSSNPGSIPILIAANGPKGTEVARRVGDGIVSHRPPAPGFDWSVYSVQGTVLRHGEAFADDRVFGALAPAIALVYHTAYQFGGDAGVDRLPGGAEWRHHIEEMPMHLRQFAVHEGHAELPPPREIPYLRREIGQLTFSGTTDDIRRRVKELEAAGVSEISYSPFGPDIPGELQAMASAVLGG